MVVEGRVDRWVGTALGNERVAHGKDAASGFRLLWNGIGIAGLRKGWMVRTVEVEWCS